jgi:hypothetical protein
VLKIYNITSLVFYSYDSETNVSACKVMRVTVRTILLFLWNRNNVDPLDRNDKNPAVLTCYYFYITSIVGNLERRDKTKHIYIE